MTRAIRRAAWPAAVLAAVVSLWSATQPADACGCGVAIEAEVNSESGLVVVGPGEEQIILSLDLESAGDERAAVILPVPGVPEVAAIEDGDPLAYLEVATRPPPEVSSGSGDEDGATAGAAPPVDVIGREEIGGYDVTRLASSDPKALDTWLDKNGYEVPDGAGPIFDSYIRQGWKFVAIRLAPDSDGRLKPLRVSFPIDIPVYPMRLSQLSKRPIDLTLYTLADGERQVEGLDTVWSGAVTELSPAPPPELAELFEQGSDVTRMEVDGAAPESFDTDLVIEPLTEIESADTPADVTSTSEEVPADDSGDGLGTAWAIVILFGIPIGIWALASLVRRRPSAAGD